MHAKQLARIGLFYLEEAILDVLPSPSDEHIKMAQVNRLIGMHRIHQEWTRVEPKGVSDWLCSFVLEKLLDEERVETRTEGNRRTGWRLSHSEYERRSENEKGFE